MVKISKLNEVKALLETAERARKGELEERETEKYREQLEELTDYAFSKKLGLFSAIAGAYGGAEARLYDFSQATDGYRGLEGWEQPMANDDGTLTLTLVSTGAVMTAYGASYGALMTADKILKRSEKNE